MRTQLKSTKSATGVTGDPPSMLARASLRFPMFRDKLTNWHKTPAFACPCDPGPLASRTNIGGSPVAQVRNSTRVYPLIKMNNHLRQLFASESASTDRGGPPPFTVLDVGARGGLSAPWSRFQGICRGLLFEPDPQEAQRLQDVGSEAVVYPYAVAGKTGRRPFYVLRHRGSSSLYPPNMEYLNQFPEPELFDIDATVEVEVYSLDDLAKHKDLEPFDFVKLDVQGAELEILEGGEALIRERALGLQVEVEFQTMYEGQPLFRDVDRFVAEKLELDIQDVRYTCWRRNNDAWHADKGQVVFGDALYFLHPDKVSQRAHEAESGRGEVIVKKAVFMGAAFGFFDYSKAVIEAARTSAIVTDSRATKLLATIQDIRRSPPYSGIGSRYLKRIGDWLGRSVCVPAQRRPWRWSSGTLGN